MSLFGKEKKEKKLELAPMGHANSIVEGFPLSTESQEEMIQEASIHFGKFLTALKVDWEKDPNSKGTPMRIAKAYVKDLWAGRYRSLVSSDPTKHIEDLTAFPADGYDGMVLERSIPLVSMCSHHHQTIKGIVHIAYLPGSTERSEVIGLSKLNRIVEQYGRRGAIQEQLTQAIHNAIDIVCKENIGVAVTVVAEHNCVSCRGIGHQGCDMVTTKVSGKFRDPKEGARIEYFDSIGLAK